MKIKTILLKSGVVVLMLLLLMKVSFAQTSSQNVETVVYKLSKSDYEQNQKELKESLSQINGVTVSKFCTLYNKIYAILKVNRTIQPDDTIIINSIKTFSIGFKKIESKNQDIINACN